MNQRPPSVRAHINHKTYQEDTQDDQHILLALKLALLVRVRHATHHSRRKWYLQFFTIPIPRDSHQILTGTMTSTPLTAMEESFKLGLEVGFGDHHRPEALPNVRLGNLYLRSSAPLLLLQEARGVGVTRDISVTPGPYHVTRSNS